MRPEVQQRLLDLNRRFYATVAEEFDRSRQGLPEGMRRLAHLLREQLPSPMRVLDVGCGNGRFARALAEIGVVGDYTGLDADERLLALARAQTRRLERLSCRFMQVDLARPDWGEAATEAPYDAVVALAVLHHFPGRVLRQQLMQEMASLLAPWGLLGLSTWQFLSASRFLDRTLSWGEIGLDEADVEPGDALLPWNQGVHAVRYVHHLDLTEIEELVASCGLRIVDHFRADGKEGNLNLFVVAQRTD
ncbi:MAG: class I SAM-dependent methyltransferase [Caldilinea sp.]|nr:class I SAM-dependent methyltransferase [Caldilinea sp.]MDW8442221.1 class I SAM-dependent methyltransferase [Caldilineaceae bacterium]